MTGKRRKNYIHIIVRFYGIIDNLLLGEDSLDEKNNRICTE